MHIKLFDQSQIDILKAMNPILKKDKIPKETLYEMEFILRYRKKSRNDHIALIVKPVKNDTSDILKELWLFEEEIEIPDNNFHPIGNEDDKKKKVIWTWFDIFLPREERTIFVVYPMKRKDLYSKRGERLA